METIAVAKRTLLKQTMADDGTDMNATKKLCYPLRTTDNTFPLKVVLL